MTKTEIKVGDWIEFKCDVEQSAEVVEIKSVRLWSGEMEREFLVKAPDDGFSGGYIGRSDFHTVMESDCFHYNQDEE